jgi:hypothetical protein
VEFFIDIKSYRSHYGPRVDSASNRNEYQEHFLGVNAAGAVRLSTLPLSCAIVMKSGNHNFLEPSGLCFFYNSSISFLFTMDGRNKQQEGQSDVFIYPWAVNRSITALEALKKVHRRAKLKITLLSDPQFAPRSLLFIFTKTQGTVNRFADTGLAKRWHIVNCFVLVNKTQGSWRGDLWLWLSDQSDLRCSSGDTAGRRYFRSVASCEASNI